MGDKELHTLSQKFGYAVLQRRQKLGLTQADLAEALGIEQHSLSRMEKGVMAPKFSRLGDMAEQLDCTVADLFRQTMEVPDGKAAAISNMLSQLPPEFQDVVVNLVEDAVLALKKLNKI